MKPRIPITSPEFKYVDAAHTDLSATFKRIRREQREAEEKRKEVQKVVDIRNATIRG